MSLEQKTEDLPDKIPMSTALRMIEAKEMTPIIVEGNNYLLVEYSRRFYELSQRKSHYEITDANSELERWLR